MPAHCAFPYSQCNCVIAQHALQLPRSHQANYSTGEATPAPLLPPVPLPLSVQSKQAPYSPFYFLPSILLFPRPSPVLLPSFLPSSPHPSLEQASLVRTVLCHCVVVAAGKDIGASVCCCPQLAACATRLCHVALHKTGTVSTGAGLGVKNFWGQNLHIITILQLCPHADSKSVTVATPHSNQWRYSFTCSTLQGCTQYWLIHFTLHLCRSEAFGTKHLISTLQRRAEFVTPCSFRTHIGSCATGRSASCSHSWWKQWPSS